MTTQTFLYDIQEVIGMLWSEHQSPERKRILELARDALFFVYATGQRYRLEDFRKNLELGPHRASGTLEQPGDGFASLKERLSNTSSFFTNLREETDSAKEKGLLQAILDTLHFISSTGQHKAFSEYLEHVEADAPPYVIDSFDTKEEAEAWLRNHPSPPDFAYVLIGNDYHDVMHDRERNARRLPRTRCIEYYLAELKQKEPPVATASFATREEAETWMKAQPEPARRAWVSIAGEFYLAVYHPNIKHRALYPLSMSEGYEVEPDEPQEPEES